jgi:hypothetical protein
MAPRVGAGTQMPCLRQPMMSLFSGLVSSPRQMRLLYPGGHLPNRVLAEGCSHTQESQHWLQAWGGIATILHLIHAPMALCGPS